MSAFATCAATPLRAYRGRPILKHRSLSSVSRKQLPWWHTLRKKRHIGLTFYMRGCKGEFKTIELWRAGDFLSSSTHACLFDGRCRRCAGVKSHERTPMNEARLMANATLASSGALFCRDDAVKCIFNILTSIIHLTVCQAAFMWSFPAQAEIRH